MLKQNIINTEFESLSKQEGLLPIKVTPFYQKKIDQEVNALGHYQGPLHRIAYPSEERISRRLHSEVNDFVDDRSNSKGDTPHTFIIRKYTERLLFMPTSECIANCQYCFRTDVLTENGMMEKASFDSQLDALKDYLNLNPEISEVILSGGDPLILPYSQLQKTFELIEDTPSVESIRIHTRAIVYGPNSITDDKIELFARYKVRVVFHIAHPYEICDEVEAKINQMRMHGIRMYNQFPLLRHTNDHSKVLIELLKKLDCLGVRNLSIYAPDPIKYSASFRIRLARFFTIMDELNWSTPSWINASRFVLDSPHGKFYREDYQYTDSKEDIAYFKRNGELIAYPDFPQHLDKPGELATMLWKN